MIALGRKRREIVDNQLYCKRCDRWQPTSEFGACRGTATGYSLYCRDCNRALSRAIYARNPPRDHIRSYRLRKRPFLQRQFEGIAPKTEKIFGLTEKLGVLSRDFNNEQREQERVNGELTRCLGRMTTIAREMHMIEHEIRVLAEKRGWILHSVGDHLVGVAEDLDHAV